VPESSADTAGLRAGDELLAIDGKPVPAAGSGKKAYARLGLVEGWVEEGLKRGALSIVFRRDGVDKTAELAPRRGCASRFQLVPGAKLNATANGTYVQVSGALVEFVRNDDELALVMAHELAHNILGHRAQLDAAGVSRGLFAGFGKNRTRIRATELEADRYAHYLVARAGYDVTVAPAFWERFGRKVDAGIFADGTHPGTKERVRRAEADVARIKAQLAASEPPTP
jgi:predicted Zn-dependent protease